jgi:hypothetical protein
MEKNLVHRKSVPMFRECPHAGSKNVRKQVLSCVVTHAVLLTSDHTVK